MFSLIIAIVAIALVVAITLVGNYYGGSALSDAQALAEAVRLKNEEQQILGAVDVFNADHGRWPADVQELVGLGYLTSVPQGVILSRAPGAGLQLIASAFAQVAGLGWTTPAAGQPIFTTAWSVPQLVCSKYNLISRGDDGILKQPFESLPAQCYGSADTFRVVITKSGAAAALAGALSPEGVMTGGLPGKDGGPSWWDTAPKGDITVPVDPEKVSYALLALQPASSLDFGAVQLGVLKTSSTRILTNKGNLAAESVLVTAPEGFKLASNNCSSELTPGASCSFAVQFNPTSAQAYAGNLTVNSANGGTVALALAGVGQAASASQTSPIFGTLDAGTSVNRDAVLVNTGVGPLTLSHPSVTGAGFEVVSEGACFGVLEAGASCTVTVRLTGEGMTAHQGTLTIPSVEAGNLTATLTGQSQRSIATLTSAASITLADWYQVGSVTDVITYRNDGNKPMTLRSPALSSPLSVAANTCTSVSAGEHCTITVALTRNANIGGSSAQTFIPSGADTAPTQTTVNWNIKSAIPNWSVVTLDFGTVDVGQTATKSLTLTNTGSAENNWAANNGVVNLPEGFTFDLSACSSVGPGQSGPVGVMFAPPAVKNFGGTNIYPVSRSLIGNTLTVTGTGQTPPVGQVSFTSPGTYIWTVPAGVTSISMVAIGGGGNGVNSASSASSGAGGALSYSNNIPVSPGDTLEITVGNSGRASYANHSSRTIVNASAGQSGQVGANSSGGCPAAGTGYCGGNSTPTFGSGYAGGAAAGYTKNGASNGNTGTGLFGVDSTGTYGRGGSSAYGSGAGNGNPGALRIIWGPGRSFPYYAN